MTRPTLTVLAGGRAAEEEWWWRVLREIGRQFLAESPSPITSPDVDPGEDVTSPIGADLVGQRPAAAGRTVPAESGRPHLHLVAELPSGQPAEAEERQLTW